MFKIGDRIKMFDGSYVFGVKNGKYDVLPVCRQKGPFTVIQVNLSVMARADRPNQPNKNLDKIADILITDNDDGFWFTPSCFAQHVMHTIAFDGEETVKISHKSYEALKQVLSQS